MCRRSHFHTSASSDIIFGLADVAQTVEQLIRNEKVEGSIPFIGTSKYRVLDEIGH